MSKNLSNINFSNLKKIIFQLIYNFLKLFSIDKNSGLITVAKPIDREQKAVYFVNIFAKDMGTPSLNASTTLEIVLEDGIFF